MLCIVERHSLTLVVPRRWELLRMFTPVITFFTDRMYAFWSCIQDFMPSTMDTSCSICHFVWLVVSAPIPLVHSFRSKFGQYSCFRYDVCIFYIMSYFEIGGVKDLLAFCSTGPSGGPTWRNGKRFVIFLGCFTTLRHRWLYLSTRCLESSSYGLTSNWWSGTTWHSPFRFYFTVGSLIGYGVGPSIRCACRWLESSNNMRIFPPSRIALLVPPSIGFLRFACFLLCAIIMLHHEFASAGRQQSPSISPIPQHAMAVRRLDFHVQWLFHRRSCVSDAAGSSLVWLFPPVSFIPLSCSNQWVTACLESYSMLGCCTGHCPSYWRSERSKYFRAVRTKIFNL